jgi:hypothetical protein
VPNSTTSPAATDALDATRPSSPVTDTGSGPVRGRLRIALEAASSRWTAPLAIWLASRIWSTILLGTMFVVATAAGWTFRSYRADPSFFTFMGQWDASFYRAIAIAGYPTTLPTDAAGHVLPNPWAFLPVYPGVVRLVMTTGMSYWVAGFLVALFCGAFAVVVLYRLMVATGCSHRARWGVALFAFGPLGFVLQISYAESMFLLLLFGALLALVQRRYWLVAVLGTIAAFTRPGILALAVAVAVHLVVRFVQERRAFGWGARLQVVGTGLLLAASGLAWPVIAERITGTPDAYVRTELSWWVGFVGHRSFEPLTPWFEMADKWLGVLGVVLVLAVMAGFAWFMTRRRVRAVGSDVLSFVWAYGVYLFAVFLPQESVFRLLMPMAPVLGSDMFVRTRRRAVTWFIVGAALQPVAIVLLWFVSFP